MVVFTCQGCNAALRRNQIEQHMYSKRCRPLLLTCIDCLKDFRGVEYESHKSCITEAAKYGGKDFVEKQQGSKQIAWMESVQEVLKKNHPRPDVNSIFNFLKKLNSNTIPKQQKRFINFLKSTSPSLYHRHQAAVECAFTVLLENYKEMKSQSNPQAISNCEETHEEKKKSNKRNSSERGTDKVDDSQSAIDLNAENVEKNKKKKKISLCNENVDLNIQTQLNNSTADANSSDLKDEHKKKKNKKNKNKKNKKSFTSESNDTNMELDISQELINHNGFNLDKSEQLVNVNDKESKDITDNSSAKEVKTTMSKKERRKHEKRQKKDVLNALADESLNLDSFFNVDTCNDKSVNDKDGINAEDAKSIEAEVIDALEDHAVIENSTHALSKKEKKMKKKQAKYEAEVAEIENYKQNEIEENCNEQLGLQQTKSKKQKKRKHDSEIVFTEEKKAKLEAEEGRVASSISSDPLAGSIGNCEPFNWEDTIINVLRHRSSMAIKKLRKKVIGEYVTRFGEQKDYERINKKFDKKITKVKGLVIAKDKATLISAPCLH